ncbi:hypothetical protein TW73_10055 [Pseudoalteromonas piscicida]|nr:hypothetical protein TW73_10055 [Pseudoalteromonas piscicida]
MRACQALAIPFVIFILVAGKFVMKAVETGFDGQAGSGFLVKKRPETYLLSSGPRERLKIEPCAN